MILLWGIPEDTTLLAVYNALKRYDIPIIFIDQNKLLHTTIKLQITSKDIAGFLKIDDSVINLRSINGAYIRPYNIKELFHDQPDNILEKILSVDEALSCWTELTSALVINRSSAMVSNSSKPYQLMKIKSFGFEVPETLITTDPKSALKFWKKHNIVIYKSISSVRSIVSRLTQQHIDRLINVKWCPTQFQKYIHGVDFRVHVIGNEVFTCQIISTADDYRYAPYNIEIIPFDLPANISYKCKSLTKEMGLVVSGIDLRFTSEGKWYCFEVNPSPAFTYYQKATKQPIDEAIANLLINGKSTNL